jgi:uncharacterized protein
MLLAYMANPFRYQGPVAPHRLIDRASELDMLQRAAADRVAVRLAAPRRFGKTSLLDAHVGSMRRVGHRAVRIDFSQATALADVAARIAIAFQQLPPDPSRTLERVVGDLELSLSTSGIGLTRRPAAQIPVERARVALLELLDLPRRLHESDRGLTVVCMDEFQDLLVADDQIDGLIRSVIQHHAEAAAYVYAGSAPSLMRALFTDRERPFYGQARRLELPRLPEGEAIADIHRMFSADGLAPGAAVSALVRFSEGHPQRTMLLCHHLYNQLDAGEPADVGRAVDLALAETADVHQAVWDLLGRPERIVLGALASGQAPTGSVLAREHRIARATLQKALERLARDEQHVVRAESGPRLLDPLLGEWLRRR